MQTATSEAEANQIRDKYESIGLHPVIIVLTNGVWAVCRTLLEARQLMALMA